MTSAVVVGGGISGLVAARALAIAGFAPITVLESTPRWGGKVAALELDGVQLDSGAESVLARRPEGVDLIAQLGLADLMVHPSNARSQLLLGGSVHPLPASVLGVPQDLDQLSGILSAEGLRRARLEPELPAPPLTTDVGIGSFVDDRFGHEVTDRLLEPLLGGVYAGQARQLSFAAVSTALYERVRQGGSLLRHAQQTTGTGAVGPVFAGLDGGLATLVDALVEDLLRRGVTLRSRVTARELSVTAAKRYRLVCGPVPAPETLETDAVVLAAPAGPTGRLLASLTPAAEDFAAIPYASTAVVTMVVEIVVPTGSGLLAPVGELPTIKAMTHSSNKWDWVNRQARATWGADASVVRASVGRFGDARQLQISDGELLRRTFAEATTLPGWRSATLVDGHLQRWGGALPQYLVGHWDVVASVRASLANQPGLAVCGAAMDGVGIAACVASATAAAAKIEQELGLASTAEHRVEWQQKPERNSR
jgi:oxygen-dependent protoporphyrinogen oxidase